MGKGRQLACASLPHGLGAAVDHTVMDALPSSGNGAFTSFPPTLTGRERHDGGPSGSDNAAGVVAQMAGMLNGGDTVAHAATHRLPRLAFAVDGPRERPPSWQRT